MPWVASLCFTVRSGKQRQTAWLWQGFTKQPASRRNQGCIVRPGCNLLNHLPQGMRDHTFTLEGSFHDFPSRNCRCYGRWFQETHNSHMNVSFSEHVPVPPNPKTPWDKSWFMVVFILPTKIWPQCKSMQAIFFSQLATQLTTGDFPPSFHRGEEWYQLLENSPQAADSTGVDKAW